MEVESERDKELLWIAKEAMGAALPAGWTQHEDKDGEHPTTQTLRLFSCIQMEPPSFALFV